MSTVASALGTRSRPVGVHLASAAEVPPGERWLGPRERDVLATLRFPKRRADWRLGRYAAKHVAAASLACPTDLDALAALEVLADDTGGPRLHVGDATPIALSLSHRAGHALAAMSPGDVALGCDLELIEPRSEAFLVDFFTPLEQALVAAGGPADCARRATLIWCAKECALKALRQGLRLDTRSVELSTWQGEPAKGWWPVAAQAIEEGTMFEGWWRQHGSLLACVLGAPSLDAPSFG